MIDDDGVVDYNKCDNNDVNDNNGDSDSDDFK